MTSDNDVQAVMGKSKSRFDLNRDTSHFDDSIWYVKIRFEAPAIRFAIRFEIFAIRFEYKIKSRQIRKDKSRDRITYFLSAASHAVHCL